MFSMLGGTQPNQDGQTETEEDGVLFEDGDGRSDHVGGKEGRKEVYCGNVNLAVSVTITHHDYCRVQCIASQCSMTI